VLNSSHDLPDLTSISTPINHHTQKTKFARDCIYQMNSVDLSRTPVSVFEPDPLNTFNGIKAIITTTFEEEPLEAYFVNNQTLPPCGTLTGQTQPGRVVVWTSLD